MRLHVFKLSIVNCQLSILILLLFFSISTFAQVETDGDLEDFTKEVMLAVKYDRCDEALNMLMDKERAEDTLSVQHRYLMAEAFSCMGSFKTALYIYNNLLKQDNDNPLYLHRRAQLYVQLQNWKKAYGDCMHLRKLMPREYSYCKMCGEVALAAERYSDAGDFLHCHLVEYTEDVDAQYIMALAYQGMKDYNNALLLINVCIEAKPQMGVYYLARAEIYEQLDMLKFAAGDYTTYLEHSSTDHKTWLQYALLLHKMERKTEACKAFEQSKTNGNLDAGRYIYRFCK